MRPLTAALPKPLLPLMGVPFAHGLIRQLAGAGVTSATFLVGPDNAPWQALLPVGAELGLRVDLQPEETPLATAGGCRRLFGRRPPTGPVIVCNADVLSDLDYGALLAEHHARGAVATVALSRTEDTSRFGVIVCDEDGRVERCVEKPPPGTVTADTVNIGSYVLEPDTFAGLDGDGPLSFEHDVLPWLAASGRVLIGAVLDCYWQDLGTPKGYLDAHRAILERRCPWQLSAGLRVGPGLAAVDASARVDPAAQIGPMAVIGARCVVGPDAVIVNSVLHDGVRVGAGAQVKDAVLGAGTLVAAGTRVSGVAG
jgi:NDP-sugar pyrophosphorylase family protein